MPSHHCVSLSHRLLWSCALLANAVAHAQYASPDEYRSVLDTNGDNRVSLREYQDHLSEAFRTMDANRNEVIDLSEFNPAVVGPNTRPISLAHYHARLAAVFRAQDVDHNGSLDTRELALPPR